MCVLEERDGTWGNHGLFAAADARCQGVKQKLAYAVALKKGISTSSRSRAAGDAALPGQLEAETEQSAVLVVGEARMAAKKKAKRAAGRRLPGGKKRRSATKRKTVTRVKGGLGRNRKTGKFAKNRRHPVKTHRRKVAGRRRKALVRRYMSHEAAPKKRRRAKRAAGETVMTKKRRRRASKRWAD